MKRTDVRKKRELKLKQRLELVRTTVRELTPSQLDQIKGATETEPTTEKDPGPWCPPFLSGE
jgi:hypothetical protein